jgi:hypothetical protein
MTETDAEFVDRITSGSDARKVIGFSEDAARLFALARRGAAAGDMLEALKELADLYEATVNGDYKPDSFTLQPARAAILKAGESNDH